MSDPVNHPKHYSHGKFEVIDVIEDWGLGFNDGNVVKYVARHRHKNGLEDLKKARWYLDREIARLGGDEPAPAKPSPKELVALLTVLTPEEQDSITEDFAGIAWGTRRLRSNFSDPKRCAELFPREKTTVRVLFLVTGLLGAPLGPGEEFDVDLSDWLGVGVQKALAAGGVFVTRNWEARNSQGNRLPLDAPLDPRLVPDGKVLLAPATGHGG